MGKALYRKYRPTSLADVVGQAQVTTPLAEAIAKGNISHAYLFTGPRGCGKTSVARIFAHAINDFDYQVEDSYLDIIEIDAASNTGVDDIRELREKAIIAPSAAKYKVYIIDEVHMLSKSAFNALLKILEEPPVHVVFVMATTNPEKVPVTVLSRAQNYIFKLADPEIMATHLAKIAAAESIQIAPDAVKVIVARGGGSFRDSISLLDQISNLKTGEITTSDVEAALGLPEEQQIDSLLTNFTAGNSTATIDTLRQLLDSGVDAETLAGDLIQAIVAQPTPATLALITHLFKVQAPFASAKLLVAFLNSAPLAQNTAAATPIVPTPTTPPAVAEPTPTPAPIQPATPPMPAPPIDPPTLTTPAAPPAPTEPLSPPAPTTTSADPATPKPITSEAFVAEILAEMPALTNTFTKAVTVVNDSEIDIYPAKAFDQKVLLRDSHLNLLKSHSRGRAIIIHDPKDPKPHHRKTTAPKHLDHVSDIMGVVEEETSVDDPF